MLLASCKFPSCLVQTELLPIVSHPCQQAYGVKVCVEHRGRVAHCIKKTTRRASVLPENKFDYSSQRTGQSVEASTTASRDIFSRRVGC